MQHTISGSWYADFLCTQGSAAHPELTPSPHPHSERIMATTSDSPVSCSETDTRYDEIRSSIEAWIDDPVVYDNNAQAREEFQEWPDVQSCFPTIPTATRS